MGNYVSCVSFSFNSSSSSSNTVKVVLHDGSAREFEGPVKAAELMLDNAQQFVSHSGSLHVGRRPAPLAADEDLEPGHVYLMLPMHRLGSPLTASDVASLVFKADSVRSPKGRARILPVLNYICPLPVMERCQESGWEVAGSSPAKEGKGREIVARTAMEVEDVTRMHRLAVCRSWKPALETITEIPLAVK